MADKKKKGGLVDPIPFKKRRRIAYEYWCTKKSVADITKDHSVAEAVAWQLSKEFDRRSFTKDKPFSILKVDPEDLETAVEILYAVGIKVEMPPENSELIEQYESKLNDDYDENRERETT